MKDSKSYWSRFSSERHTRRRALQAGAAGGLAAGVAAMVGCGGGSDDGDSSAQTGSGLLTVVKDTTKDAIKGGTYKAVTSTDAQTFDPIAQGAELQNTLLLDAYQRPVRPKKGLLKPEPRTLVDGDAFESWEYLDGGLTLVMKMRPNNGLDPRAPTNGRMLDPEDMAFSWRKFEQISTFRGTLSNNASKDAPVQSVTVVDKNTIRMKMAFPDADFLFLFGEGYWVQPREAESRFDPKGTIRGSGPLMMTEHRPSALAVYERNPGAFDASTFNIAKVELPVVPEASTRLSQFRAGNIYAFGVPQQDIVQTKKDIPDLDLYSNGLAGLSTQAGFAMVGWLEGSPFRDPRVRQALSMAIDEDAFISTFYNKDTLAAAGLDVEVFYNSPSTTAADRPWYLDPKSRDFGPNSKFLTFNVAEAKKLLAAAGYANGFETTAHYFTTGQYGSLPNYVAAAIGMYQDIGIQVKSDVIAYQPNWLDGYFGGRGKYQGMSFATRSGNPGNLTLLYTRAGSRYFGFDVNGRDPENGDPQLEDTLKKQRSEFDEQKRIAVIHDVQRYLAQQQYYPRLIPAVPTTYSINWPILRDLQTYFGEKSYQHVWLDPSRPPRA